ncbi:signal peptidase II [Calycomorphotria hydatis]|uniref:Lipoprotein signal peptidase n=1 Tax=Calycomorphotria hydatis TaxID=2528027 RepID=A0A517TDF3_9PLAN|nr:signal peptidase II [Calycomorphotria hydatis]QDT66408.1 lipoprotein signal peptidase [Calycomorphotria hydatis]
MKSVPANRYWIFGLLVVVGLAADLVSKRIVFQFLGAPDGSTNWLIDSWLKFRLYTTFNEGALWGIGQGWTGMFAVFSIAAAIGVMYWLFVAGAARSSWLTVALAFVMAGTLGNLFDRAGMHGWARPDGESLNAVRDFLHFRFGTFDWAIFNIADVLLVTGAIMLGIQSFFHESKEETTSEEEPASSQQAA